MENGEIENSTDEVLEINKKKKDFKIELMLFFILGFLLGVTFKTEAAKRITIGFEDYKISAAKDSYDASEIKRRLSEEAQKELEETQKVGEQTQGEIQVEDGETTQSE